MSGTASYATPAPTRSPDMTHHHLHSSPETCHWGFFEAKLKPVLTIASVTAPIRPPAARAATLVERRFERGFEAW